MHEQDDQVHVQHKGHPTVIYSSSIPFTENKTGQFVDQYQQSAPSPGEASNELQITGESGNIDPHLCYGCHSISKALTPPVSHGTTYPSPETVAQYSLNSKAKRPARLLKNTLFPIPYPSQETDSWNWVSKSRMMTAGTVKRSVSTPNVHHAAAMSASSVGAQFSTDKRRNKLGYHRTSVACGHCRRRKIRCLLHKDDSQGRCSNCIRLKKECNFYPVETTDRRQRSFSKSDLSTNEASSSASSPSPGLALEKLPRDGAPSPYSVSVPVTPTYNYRPGLLKGSMRHNSISSVTSGRLSISHSTTASRKPSLAHIIPGSKKEHEYLSSSGMDDTSFSRSPGFAMDSVSEGSISQPDHRGLDTAFWRLTSPMSPNPFPNYSHHVNLGNMPSLHSANPSSSQEDPTWPPRMNTTDSGLMPGIYQNYSVDVDYNRGFSGLYNTSTSAATTPLTAPMPEVTQYADSRVANQLFMSSWVDVGAEFNGGGTVKNETYNGYYTPDIRYQDSVEENSGIFPSPLHSPKFVSQI